MLIAATGSLVTAAADGFAGLALGRAMIGLGMAGVLMGALKAFAAWFEPRRFATMSGVFVGLGSLGALGATTPLAALADGIGWRGVFVAAGAVTAAVAALLTVVVRAAPAPAAGGTTAPPVAPSPAADDAVAPAAVSFRAIYAHREFWRLALMQFAMAGALYGHQGLWGGPFLVRGLDLEVGVAARLLLVLGLAATVGFLVAGPAAGRFGLRRAFGGGALLTLAAVAALAVAPPSTSVAALAVVWAAFGLGAGLQVLGYDGARSLFPSAAGRAVTAINVFGIGGSALMQMGLGWVVAGASAALGADPADPPLAAYRAALWTTAAVLALAWLHFVVRRR
jgi:MFS family permease